jgi:macrolide transport system ATP-binding/permease protein
VFSVNTLVAAVVSSTLVGVVFGFAPARNAARLDPVVALARDC